MTEDISQPLVSCLMPTYNRRQFIPHALEYFFNQDYANRELIIVDDGTDPISDLVPADQRILYVRLDRKITLGAKLNMACEYARGEIMAHWDDDDWYAPTRLSYQVAGLAEGVEICGINRLLYYDLQSGRAYEYIYPREHRVWLLGSELCYRKSFWQNHRFVENNVGMDARFVWSADPRKVLPLKDHTFAVHMIHQSNVSPKKTEGGWWHSYSVEAIAGVLGADWEFYKHHGETANGRPRARTIRTDTITARENRELTLEPAATPVRNVFACLVHENSECVVDLVRNLKYHDPNSVVLLYNGGRNPDLLNHGFPFEKYGAVVHPSPRQMKWGWLHGFALDSMKFALDNFSFDTFTVVDSDQIAMRSGYSQYLAKNHSRLDHVGMLGNSPSRQTASTKVPPAVQAWLEFELWRAWLQRFRRGEEKFVHWTFWPSTVFTRDAMADLINLFTNDEGLRDIMSRSKIWATEEVVLPTLVALLDYQIEANPCSYDYVKYRARYSMQQLNEALNRGDVFWMHPVPRQYGDRLRNQIRTQSRQYEIANGASPCAAPAGLIVGPSLVLNVPILAQMRTVEGWLEESEADLLIAAASHALRTLPAPHSVVEVGSYCGRATVVLGGVARALSSEARIYSIDTHDGKLGALDQGLVSHGPTLEKFKRTIQRAELNDIVEIIQKRAIEVAWQQPISLLLIDGLHDYASVAQDFYHFEKWVAPEGIIAFHDYANYFPGVLAFVNELLSSGKYRKVRCVGSLMVVQKT